MTRIVKVQLSQYTTGKTQRMLIYDEKRNWLLDSKATESIIKTMNGRPKAYFTASLVNGEIRLMEEVGLQSW